MTLLMLRYIADFAIFLFILALLVFALLGCAAPLHQPAPSSRCSYPNWTPLADGATCYGVTNA